MPTLVAPALAAATDLALRASTWMPLLDEQPEPEDVTAGWTAFAIFGLLGLAVVLLGLSLTRHLRRADRAETEGRFDPSRPGRQLRQQLPSQDAAADAGDRDERS